MDILVNVANQKLRIATNLKSLVSGTQEFVRFIFKFTDDWSNLTAFAQFTQNGVAYNQFLDDENSAFLPAEIKSGACTLMLYGSGDRVIATTNYIMLKIDENILVEDGQSTDISLSLYNQLITRIDHKLENNEYVATAIEKSVENEMQRYLDDGILSNLVIANGSVSMQKLGDDVKDMLNSAARQDEIDYLHPLTITSFSVSPKLAEKGSTVNTQQFTYKVNRLGVTVTLEGESLSNNTASRSDILTSDKTYELIATLNGVTKTAFTNIQFVAPIYYGVSKNYELNNDTVLALKANLATTRSSTFTVSAASGQYILYAISESMGTPTFKVGGFEGGFTLVGLFDFTNASGHTESYRLYRTVNAGLGSTTVSVS